VHDYIHVADVARANVMAMQADVSGEAFNVVTGVATSLNRVVEILLEIAGSKLRPEYKSGSSQIRSSTGSRLDFSREKIEKMLGWKPEIPIEDGIRRLIDWRRREAAGQA
jgi:UDP-glucose 4-epimerase